MQDVQIFHNPRCSKSRQTLALLEQRGITADIVLYLEDVPTKKTLKSLQKKLSMDVRDMLRTSEDAYKRGNLSDKSLTDEQLLEAMIVSPKLIQRPIVVVGDKAVIGRPPENVLAIID